MKNTLVLQLIFRAIAVSGLSIFIYRLYLYSQFNVLSLNIWLLTIGEIITLVLVIFARFAKALKLDFISVISMTVATYYFLFISFGDGITLLPSFITSSIQVLALCFQIYAKICLGFSFGLLPANRGIVTRGAYRIVRHPIYFGYFLNHLGFILSNFNLNNLVIFAILYFFQSIRIWQEEKVLMLDTFYQTYANRVKYRFLPYIF